MLKLTLHIGRAILFAAIAVAHFATLAQAQPVDPSYLDGDDLAWFYNKPGVTLQDYRADEAFCSTAGRANFGPRDPGAYGSGLVTDAFAAGLTPGWFNLLRDSCMRTREYRRFELRPGNQRLFAQQLASGGDEALARYVADATPPAGTLAGQWSNAFLGAESSLYAQDTLITPTPTQLMERTETILVNFFYYRGRSLKEFSSGDVVDRGLATVVIAMSTPESERTAFNRNLLLFLNVDPATSNIPAVNGHPTFLNLGQWNRDREPQRFQIYQVPAGRYALWRYIDRSNVTTDFCLRTFAFDVAAGDVVYAGRWHLAGSGPITATADDTEAARGALNAISPTLGAEMQSASYHNGVQLPCGGYMPRSLTPYGISLPLRPQ